MSKVSAAVLLSVLIFSLAACVASDTLIKINSDGSGLIVQRTLMKTEMIAQLRVMMEGMVRQMAGPSSGTSDVQMPEIFGEKEAAAKAAKMGSGVTYLESRKLKTGDMEGVEAAYAFRDVTQLRLSEKPEAPSIPGLQGVSSGKNGETIFRFSRRPNGNSLLTAMFAQSKPAGPAVKDDSAERPTSTQVNPKQLEQARKMFDGLRIAMAIEVQGNLVKTNSPYQEGSKVTLMEMDFSALLSNEALLSQMAATKGQSLEQAKELLKGLKGFKINLEPEVTIEFAGGTTTAK